MNQKILIGCLITISIQIILTKSDPYTCGSIEIHNEDDLKKIQGCVRIGGYVQLTNFRITNTSNIATSIEEISNYLLVYRIEGLESLEDIFPSLTIIRGHDLLFDRYSLVVYENREIRDIGLKSLLKVRNGHIKIESNPVLCYTKTVNWIYLLENHLTQHFFIQNNQNDNECPKCVKIHEELEKDNFSEFKYFRFNCWNKNTYQLKKPFETTKGCPETCKDTGCSNEGECCSPFCLSGCHAENCRICKDFKNFNGKCIPTCNIPYYKLGDKCLTENQCKDMRFIPHAGFCIENCPPSYQKDNDNLRCNLKCKGNFTIRSKKDLENVRDCVVLLGSLHIELKGDQSDNIIQELESALGGITEIRDYLKVTNSPQLMSLGFFRKLDTIRGENLIDQEVALFVVDNFHMEEIWPANHKVAIFNGRIFFHLNPRLCYEKILELAPSIKNMDKIEIRDASHNSNGERTICGSEVKQIYPIIEAYNATAARVKLTPLASSDRYSILGYLFYYKEAPLRNVTMFDGRHGCGRDNWIMDMQLNPNIRHVFSNLKPNTQYAYFVKTFSSLENNYQKQDWYSAIQYFTTKTAKPGAVQKIYSLQIADTAVIIHWWPPKNSNGIIQKYLIRHELTNHHVRYSQIFGYSPDTDGNKDCECNIKQKLRGPTPSDEDFYNREKAVYESAVMNFIYVSSDRLDKIAKENEEEEKTRRKRDSQNLTQTPEEKTTEKSVRRLDINDTETEILLKKHFAKVEQKSIREQDTGPDNFPILKPPVVCAPNSTEKTNCEPLECYLGTEVPGTMHSYILVDLIPEKIYQVFVRACVKDVPNGCGPEKFIEVETHTKKLKKRQAFL
ncbi:insulin-like receptor [Eupeodes corollae]|uniref:insulin-like receptor n=1 Tax=Eupeodes corollae TaxID=290404 RepID=UPI00248FBCE8|nr:insulin-like receptor [Eupeodes corollae]XP_055906080.1 insulin-like receptor [Eupeodes corollae]